MQIPVYGDGDDEDAGGGVCADNVDDDDDESVAFLAFGLLISAIRKNKHQVTCVECQMWRVILLALLPYVSDYIIGLVESSHDSNRNVVTRDFLVSCDRTSITRLLRFRSKVPVSC